MEKIPPYAFPVELNHIQGTTPLLPLYALLLLREPSVFTLRTLFELLAFGDTF